MKVYFEDIRYESHQSFICAESKGEEFRCPYHRHPELEITWIVSGHGYRLTGDHMAHFAPGDLILHGSNLPHLYQGWKTDIDPAHAIYFQFHPEKIPVLALPEFRNLTKLFHGAERGLWFRRAKGSPVEDLVVSTLKAKGSAKLIGFLSLLDQLAKWRSTEPLASLGYQSNLSATKTERLQRILSHIEKNYFRDLSLQEIAKVACLHPQSFSRFFRKEMTKSFQAYLIELRLSHASRELMEGQKTVIEIAFESGFTNLSNFNRQFKRHFGETPTAYQKRIQLTD